MGLEKAIQYGKEHREQYHGSKAVDSWCRNHGKCEICRLNRLHSQKKIDQSMKDKEEE